MDRKDQQCRWKSTVLARLDGSIIVPANDWSLTCEDGHVFARVFRVRVGADETAGWKWSVILGSGIDHAEVGSGVAQSRAAAIRACEERIVLVERVLAPGTGSGEEFLSGARMS